VDPFFLYAFLRPALRTAKELLQRFNGQGCSWCEIVDFQAGSRGGKKCAATVGLGGWLTSVAVVLAVVAVAVEAAVLLPFAATLPVCPAHSRGRSQRLRVPPAPLLKPQHTRPLDSPPPPSTLSIALLPLLSALIRRAPSETAATPHSSRGARARRFATADWLLPSGPFLEEPFGLRGPALFRAAVSRERPPFGANWKKKEGIKTRESNPKRAEETQEQKWSQATGHDACGDALL